MKKTLRKLISAIVSLIPWPQKIQDFLMWPIATRLLGREYAEEIILKNGVHLYGSMHDILTRNILFLGERQEYFWEPITTKLAEKLVENAQTVCIAGSHVGYDVFTLARKTKGVVHTFEPVRELFELVGKSHRANPALKVVINHTALSDSNGTVPILNDAIRSMVVSEADATDHVESVTVPTYMEKHGLAQIDLMLLDVEGHELSVLEGMQDVLKADTAPDIIYEVILRGNETKRDAIKDFLEAFGYESYIILDNYHGSGGVPKHIQVTKSNDILSSDIRYVNVLATKKSTVAINQLGIAIV